ncbi:hypothetical protein, partial [Parasynechococcus sp.]|uniref:hypothetical protein n=1 Tax=Parasynechococcus sp. TaxID=3101203 RepID=UPI003704B6FA
LLKGRRGDDVLYAGASGPDRLRGGPGRDLFWVSAETGSFVTILDFAAQSDLLVFDQDLLRVEFAAGRRGTDVLVDGVRVAFLVGTAGLTIAEHAVAQPFELP